MTARQYERKHSIKDKPFKSFVSCDLVDILLIDLLFKHQLIHLRHYFSLSHSDRSLVIF